MSVFPTKPLWWSPLPPEEKNFLIVQASPKPPIPTPDDSACLHFEALIHTIDIITLHEEICQKNSDCNPLLPT